MGSTWEENTERRMGIVEMKVDKLMDPEVGIYPKIEGLGRRLLVWAVGILTALVTNLAMLVFLLSRST